MSHEFMMMIVMFVFLFVFFSSCFQYLARVSWPWRHFEGPYCIPRPFDNDRGHIGSDDGPRLDPWVVVMVVVEEEVEERL